MLRKHSCRIWQSRRMIVSSSTREASRGSLVPRASHFVPVRSDRGPNDDRVGECGVQRLKGGGENVYRATRSDCAGAADVQMPTS